MSKSMKNRKEVTVSNPMPKRKTLYALVAGTAIVILFGIYFSSQKTSPQPRSGYQEQPAAGQSAAGQFSGANALASIAPLFNFGKISMAAGNVSHRYWIRNTGAAPLTITRITTSCMCTVATLITPAGRTYGPFGMPGHAPIPNLEERLAPGEAAQVEIVFDPAAHGPAGIGRNDRTVTIRNDAGRPLELRFNAMVSP